MSREFSLLQILIKDRKVELRLKKSLKDPFAIWAYWAGETRKPKLFWKILFASYWLFSSEWLWIPLSIFFAVKFGWFYLLCLLTPFFITQLSKPIGQVFLVSEARKNESLLDDLWQNQMIGILSIAKHESPIHKNGTPDIIIDPSTHDWKKQIMDHARNSCS